MVWGRAVFGRKGRPLSWQETELWEEGGECGSCRGWWQPDVAERLLPAVRLRALESSAGDTASIRFTFLTALQYTLLLYGSYPFSLCKHPTHRLLILFPPQAHSRGSATRCPIWAHEALDPRTWGGGHWTRKLEDGGCWVPDGKIGVAAHDR